MDVLIIYQPNPDLNLHDPDTVSIMTSLNDEQLAGLVIMACQILSPNFNDKMRIIRLADNVIINCEFYEYTDIHWIGYAKNPDFYDSVLKDGGTPYDFINEVPFYRDNGKVKVSSNNIILPYWCLLTNDNSAVLTQFLTPSFLQGAITACEWLGVNWQHHIQLIHKGQQPQEITMFVQIPYVHLE